MKTLINFFIILIISLLVFAIVFMSQIYFTDNNNIFVITTISLIPSIFSITSLTEFLYNPK
jgi:hypothetical protein